MFGDRKPYPFTQMTFDEADGAFSPDGHWIAYASGETGRLEIVVQPFPGPGTPIPISTTGGDYPR